MARKKSAQQQQQVQEVAVRAGTLDWYYRNRKPTQYASIKARLDAGTLIETKPGIASAPSIQNTTYFGVALFGENQRSVLTRRRLAS